MTEIRERADICWPYGFSLAVEAQVAQSAFATGGMQWVQGRTDLEEG